MRFSQPSDDAFAVESVEINLDNGKFESIAGNGILQRARASIDTADIIKPAARNEKLPRALGDS